MNDYDGLNLCAACGDAYTTGTLCTSCAHQQMIDNADLSMVYDALHYDPVYGYDDDDDFDADDFGVDYETWQGDNMYADDDTVELTWRGRSALRWWRVRQWVSDRQFSIELAGGLRSYIRWRLFWIKRNWWHRWHMRFDASYRKRYDDIPL